MAHIYWLSAYCGLNDLVLARLKKTFPTNSINDSPNLLALYPTSFTLYFWIAYLMRLNLDSLLE